MLCHFNIRNFTIPKYQSFYILSFQMLTPTRKKLTRTQNFSEVLKLTFAYIGKINN